MAPKKDTAELLRAVIRTDDLARLSEADRADYYMLMCERTGLDPATTPFAFTTLGGRMKLYALKTATDQLRKMNGVSITLTSREHHGDVYVVSARAVDTTGRTDESTGAVGIGNAKGEQLANALMKAECVPLDSEILTSDGFRRYDQVSPGETVLAYDCATDRCCWTKLQAVNVFEAAPTVRIGTARHGFRCTPDHKWAVDTSKCRANENRGPFRFLTEAAQIMSSQRIILSAPASGGQSTLSPADAALLGWIFCDGTIKRVGNSVRLGISQSKPYRVAEIRDLLTGTGYVYSEFTGKPTTRTFPNGRTSSCLPQSWFYLSADISRSLLSRASISSSADLPRLATELTAPARRAMLNAMMAADGTQRGVFGKKQKPGVMDAFQILATLEGIALGRLGKSSVGDVPLQRLRKQRHIAGINVEMTDGGIEPVWCPTTEYGTWVMRQGGNVTITGNTKAKRRVTLSICGLGMLDETEVETIVPRAAETPREPRDESPAPSEPAVRAPTEKFAVVDSMGEVLIELHRQRDWCNNVLTMLTDYSPYDRLPFWNANEPMLRRFRGMATFMEKPEHRKQVEDYLDTFQSAVMELLPTPTPRMALGDDEIPF